ncbi:MAG: hypothetical protein ACLSHJ_04820 [Oscillospiraceae bacterium]
MRRRQRARRREDLYQLRLYADGCAMDGMPAKESVLIGARHPKEVCSLAEQSQQPVRPHGSAVSLRAADMDGGGHQRMTPYPLINGKAAGEGIPAAGSRWAARCCAERTVRYDRQRPCG